MVDYIPDKFFSVFLQRRPLLQDLTLPQAPVRHSERACSTKMGSFVEPTAPLEFLIILYSRSVDPLSVSALASRADGGPECVANGLALCDSGLVTPSKLFARDLINFCVEHLILWAKFDDL